jgi:ectoine hydroxylase-related dioxygenase (phytanoyl-CoA dioxygenase family)
MFDSRLLHCAGSNHSGIRRTLFYFSFKARDATVAPGTLSGCCIRAASTGHAPPPFPHKEIASYFPDFASYLDRLPPLRGQFRLDARQRQLVRHQMRHSSTDIGSPDLPPYIGFPRMRLAPRPRSHN